MDTPRSWGLELLPLGGAREIGASATLVTAGDLRVLVDAGARPGRRHAEGPGPRWGLIDGRVPVQSVLLTHAHYDHIGSLVRFRRDHPGVAVYATNATIDLARLAFADGLRIAEREGDEDPVRPEEVTQALGAMRTLPLGVPIPVAEGASGVLYVTAARAGHIPGAVCLYLEAMPRDGGGVIRAVITGDVSVREQPILPGADLGAMRDWRPDLVLCEGTYGAKRHTDATLEEARLLLAIGETVAGGGVALIPAFAIGRAQNVLALLREALDGSTRWAALWPPGWRFPATTVWVDGMCRDASALLETHRHLLSARWQAYTRHDGAVFDNAGRIRMVRSGAERERLLAAEAPAIVVSSSGMLTGGASVAYAKALAPDTTGRHGIFLCGYVDEESPGALLREAGRGGQREWPLDGDVVTVRCRVQQYSLSAHADAEEIHQLLARWSPAQLGLVHGDPDNLEALRTLLQADPHFRRTEITLPSVGTRLYVGGTERGVVAWPDVGQSEWLAHWLVGRLLDDGEPAVWHGRLGQPAFRGQTGDGVVLGVHGGSPVGMPVSGRGPRAMDHKLEAEVLALRGRGTALRLVSGRRSLGAEVEGGEDVALVASQERVRAMTGRGVRSPGEGGHRRRVESWGLRAGDFVLAVQSAAETTWVFPAIVLGVHGAHFRCFAPQGADTLIPAWQLLGRVGRWPLWRGASYGVTVADWELLDTIASGFGGTGDLEQDPLARVWRAVADGVVSVAFGAATSILLVRNARTTSMPEITRALSDVGAEGVLEAARYLDALRELGWGREEDGIWQWDLVSGSWWPHWPEHISRWLENAYVAATGFLQATGVRRGALRAGAVEEGVPAGE